MIIIRLMTPADAPAVTALSAQLGYPLASEVVAARLSPLPFSTDAGRYVAERDSVIAGWIEVYGVRLLASPAFYAEVGGLVVDAGARRQGIGRALVSEAEAWATVRGYSEVRLRSGLHRADAHEFYRSLGYTLTKTSHLFRKTLAGV